MAAADLNPSRRALLGAAFAAPLLTAVEGPVLTIANAAAPAAPHEPPLSNVADKHPSPTPQRESGNSFAVTKWDRALARFRRAEGAVLALEGGPDEEAFGRAHDRFNLTLRRLFATPAPDIAALAVKLEAAVAAELADLTYAPPALAALAADARRLSSPAGR